METWLELVAESLRLADPMTIEQFQAPRKLDFVALRYQAFCQW